jgi:hypothetical protein
MKANKCLALSFDGILLSMVGTDLTNNGLRVAPQNIFPGPGLCTSLVILVYTGKDFISNVVDPDPDGIGFNGVLDPYPYPDPNPGGQKGPQKNIKKAINFIF